MSTTAALKLGPRDHGRRMSLAEFEPVKVVPGYHYELSRGVVVVSDVPKPRHLAQFLSIRRQFSAYETAHPDLIYGIMGGGECKVLLEDLQSERHPDMAIYLTPPPDPDDPWPIWVPEIVIEIVSPGSEARDYVEKREEYLQFGVKDYWAFDVSRKGMLALRRSRGRWVEWTYRPTDVYRTPLLPEFELAIAPIFQAAEAVPSKRGRKRKQG